MNADDLERLAEETYRRYGFDSEEPANAVALARALLGTPEPIMHIRWLASGNAVLFRTNDRWRIGIRRGLHPSYQLAALSHELAHLVLRDVGYDGPRLEDSCDYLGACLLAPAKAVRRLHAEFGLELASIANASATTQTWAALRLGEVLNVPLAALQPAKVRFRGPTRLHDEDHLRQWARGRPAPGVVRVPIKDAKGRVAFVAI